MVDRSRASGSCLGGGVAARPEGSPHNDPVKAETAPWGNGFERRRAQWLPSPLEPKPPEVPARWRFSEPGGRVGKLPILPVYHLEGGAGQTGTPTVPGHGQRCQTALTHASWRPSWRSQREPMTEVARFGPWGGPGYHRRRLRRRVPSQLGFLGAGGVAWRWATVLLHPGLLHRPRAPQCPGW